MFRKITACSVATLMAVGVMAGPEAKAAEYDIDPVHSAVLFKVLHFNAGYVWGRFNAFEGAFSTAEDGAMEMTIQTGSIDTNHNGRDAHLRSDDFFDAENYPEMSFTATGITPTEDGFSVEGEFTLLGETQPITLDVTKVGEGEDPQGNYRYGFEAEGTLDRTDFGMDFMVGPIGADIHLIIAVEGVRQETE